MYDPSEPKPVARGRRPGVNRLVLDVPAPAVKPKTAAPAGKPPLQLGKSKYMDKVVDLTDATGNVVFRGTRKECLRVAKQRYEEKMNQKVRETYGSY